MYEIFIGKSTLKHQMILLLWTIKQECSIKLSSDWFYAVLVYTTWTTKQIKHNWEKKTKTRDQSEEWKNTFKL